MEFGKGSWQVVGVFDAGGMAYESEIWGDVNQMTSDFDRQGVYSSAYLRATDPVAAEALKNRVSDDQRLKLDSMLEPEYYATQTKSGAVIQFIGWLVAAIMAVGSSFAAMNTMYAAVAYRSREIATLRVIGFSRPSILTSFVLEALLLSFLGAIVGIILMLPVQRNDYWHTESGHVQRGRIRAADDSGSRNRGDRFCVSDGIVRRDISSLARIEARDSGGAARLVSYLR